MYLHNTQIPLRKQYQNTRKGWFTLVEIMIVILIIVMLTQLGNLSSLFRHREKSQLEEISVQLLGTLDEEKTHALLGKTYLKKTGGSETLEIVRKRSISITIDNANNNLAFSSRVNLASLDESTYESNITTRDWHLQELSGAWYSCTGIGSGIKLDGVDDIHIEFFGDTIKFSSGNIASPTAIDVPHIVLKLTRNTANQELHIDRRTGLTYTRVGTPDQVLCN